MNQTSKQSPTERMNAISEQGLCAGCGLCQSVAGPDKIQFAKVANGYERPVVVGELDDALVERIYAVCPCTRIEGLPANEIEADTKIDNVWGPWRRMVHAWADDAETQWQLPFRCKICPDGIGEAADIAAADSWPGGSPTREGSVNDPGVNAVVARTLVGEKLLAAATEAGFLALGDDLVPDEMSEYQPHQARKKYAAYDRHRGLSDAGRIVPKTQRLRLEALAQEMPESYRQHQREGTQKRVEEGKATEPTPEIGG